MTIAPHSISTNYDDVVYNFIWPKEAVVRRIYSDPIGIPTLGIGYALIVEGPAGSPTRYVLRSTLSSDLATIGITLSQSDFNLLNDALRNLNAANGTANFSIIPRATQIVNGEEPFFTSLQNNVFSFNVIVDSQVRDLYDISIMDIRNRIQDRFAFHLQNRGLANPASAAAELFASLDRSQEMLALSSLAFTNPSLIGPNLTNALYGGDRAEAWFNIRYDSNADTIHANRRYQEANQFRLYNEGQLTDSDAKAVYRMFNRHESTIRSYETTFSLPASIQPIINELEPARTFLLTNYGQGVVIEWDRIQVGDDTRNALTGTDRNDLMFGEGAADTLAGGAGSDVLYGGNNADILIGGVDSDYLDGGQGNDVYSYSTGDGNDIISDADRSGSIIFDASLLTGGQQVDGSYRSDDGRFLYVFTGDLNAGGTLQITNGSAGSVTVNNFRQGTLGINLHDASPPPTPGGGISRGDGDYEVVFGAGDDEIFLGQGNIVVMAGDGNNQIDTGRPFMPVSPTFGSYHVVSGSGDDTISVGVGDAMVFAGDGDNNIEVGRTLAYSYYDNQELRWATYFAPGSYYVVTGSGSDSITLAHGDAIIFTGDGRDFVNSEGGNCVVDLGAGDDSLTLRAGIHVVSTGTGHDQVYAYENVSLQVDPGEGLLDDIVLGNYFTQVGSGTVDLLGAARAQTQGGTYNIYGSAADDQVMLYGGSDHQVNVGDGDNHIVVAPVFSPSVNNNVILGNGNDDVWLQGGSGYVDAGDGNNQIFLHGGDFTVVSGDGNDTYWLDGSSNPNDHGTGVIDAGGGVNTVRFFGGNYLVAENGTNGRVFLSADSSAYTLSLGSLVINVGGGQSIRIEDFDPDHAETPGLYQTFIFRNGVTLNYAELIARGFDILGTAGDDVLTGTSVIDRLVGADGNDILDAGKGDDFLDGGIGNDTYHFRIGSGADVLSDSAGDLDTLDFGNGIGVDDLTVTRTDGDLIIQIDGTSDRLTIQNWFNDTASRIERVRFADGTEWDKQINAAPTVSQPIADQLIQEDSAFRFQLSAETFTDPNLGDFLLYTARLSDGSALPSWLTFDSATQTFAGTPGQADIGALDISVTAIDFGGESVSDVFRLTIENVNDAPIVSSPIANQTAREESPFTFGVPANTFTDVDVGDTLTYSAVRDDGSPLPTWLSFNPQTRNFFGTPGIGDVGNLQIRVIATDSGGLQSVSTFNVNVTSKTIAGTAGADTLVGTSLDDRLLGLAGSDRVSGGDGDDILDGGSGNDELLGQAGSDTYLFGRGSGQDVVIENDASGGIDILRFAEDIAPADVTITRDTNNLYLSINGTNDRVTLRDFCFGIGYMVEQVTFSEGTVWTPQFLLDHAGYEIVGTAAVDTLSGFQYSDNIYGYDGNDTLQGNGGNDLLDGGAGSDTMRGGVGDDTYVVDSASDAVIENVGEGTDTIRALVSVSSLAANVENLILIGAINGTGNALANYILGSDANNLLDGLAGADMLVGGRGSDQYVVDNAGDGVIEAVNEGDDYVYSSISYTLSENTERLSLTGSATNGTGNSLDNFLYGNSANNTLNGLAGDDLLNGGAGSDTLRGGLGDDIYLVDAGTDVVIENANEGIDTVQSSVAYTLNSNVENLTLTGTGNLSGTGNTLDNVLIGNAGKNTLTGNAGHDWLDGGAGNDTLRGGAGNDIYVVDVTGDSVTENANEGTDTVRSSISYTLGSNVENLSLTGTSAINGTGNTLNNVLIGNAANNILAGNAGADTLDGGASTDTLNGGTGNDTYRFNRGYGTDTITDNDTTSGNQDTVSFGVNPLDIVFVRSGSNLQMRLHGSSDTLTVNSWYTGSQYHTELLQAADNRTLLDSQVAQLIQAMATFSANNGGITWNQAIDQRPQDVEQVIAAYWQP